MKITRYNPDRPTEGESVFYIQSHGLHAGRPLKKPIPNSWELQTDIKNAFEICFMLYNSNSLKIYLRGSVIPFLSLREYKKILLPLLENPKIEDLSTQKKLKALQDIEALLLQQEQKNTYYKQLKSLIASEVLKSFNKQ
jgi:hypothetical protein